MKILLSILLTITISISLGKVPHELDENFKDFFPADSIEIARIEEEIKTYEFGEKELILNFFQMYRFYSRGEYDLALPYAEKIYADGAMNKKFSLIKKELIVFTADVFAFNSKNVRAYILYEYYILNYKDKISEPVSRKFCSTIENFLEVSRHLGRRIESFVFIDNLIEYSDFEITHELMINMIKIAREEAFFDRALYYSKELYSVRMDDNMFDYFEYYITLSDIYKMQGNIQLALMNIKKSETHISAKYQRIIFRYNMALLEIEDRNLNQALVLLDSIMGDSLLYKYNLSEITPLDIYYQKAMIFTHLGEIKKANFHISKFDSASNYTIFKDKINPAKINLLYMNDDTTGIEFLALNYLKFTELYGNVRDRQEAIKILYKYYQKSNNLYKENKYLRDYIAHQSTISADEKRIKVERAKEEYRHKFANAEKIKNRDFNLNIYLILFLIITIISVLAIFWLVKYLIKRKSEKALIDESNRLLTSNKELKKINEDIAIEQESIKEDSILQEEVLKIFIHDINTPVSSIAISAETLIDFKDKLDNNEKSDIYDRIRNLSLFASNMITNQNEWIIKRESKNNLQLEYFEIKDHIKKLVDFNRPAWRDKKIKITLNINEEIVFASKYIFEIVIRNLLSNAIKFTKKEGNIFISTTNKNDEVIVSIQDDGVGINLETINKIKSDQLVESSNGTLGERGTGQGLKVSFGLLKRMESDFEIESIQNQGTKISFTLKRVTE